MDKEHIFWNTYIFWSSYFINFVRKNNYPLAFIISIVISLPLSSFTRISLYIFFVFQRFSKKKIKRKRVREWIQFYQQ